MNTATDRQIIRILREIDGYIQTGKDAQLLEILNARKTTKTILWLIVWQLVWRLKFGAYSKRFQNALDNKSEVNDK